MKFKGTIVEESLKDSRILNNLKITAVRISSAENPSDRWHLYAVEVSKDEINKLASELKQEKWYMHFWNGDEIIAVFPNKVFRFKHSDKSTWKPAIEYGLSLNIPKRQLDFVID